MTTPPKALVNAARVVGVNGFHYQMQAILGYWSQYQVNMIGHETIRQYLDILPGTVLLEQ